MSGQISSEPIQRVRNTEYATRSDGTEWKRKVKPDGTRTAWEAAESAGREPDKEALPVLLMLIRQGQAKGEPMHWSLFVGGENKAGSVYQVKGMLRS